jgi:hypothetical protein
MIDLPTIFFLLIIFQLKHFIADYPLQNPYMLGKFREDWGFFWPLFAHVTIHAVITLGIIFVVKPSLWYLAIVDLVTHFIIDRVKAGKRYLGRWGASHPLFWWSLGLDQMLHHFVHYYIIYSLLI